MALTLTEGTKLSTDILKVGVIENIIKESPILQRLPFIDMMGNSLKYNRELALGTTAFYAVADTWGESAPTFTAKTASLCIMGGDADVDCYIQKTRSNVQDIQAAVIALKAKSMAHKFEDAFINGDTGVDANSFVGLRLSIGLTAGTQLVSMGGTGAALTLEKIDELIDTIRGGKPDMLLMSRRSRRKMTSLMRALGSMDIRLDEFGRLVEHYNGIPVYVNDWILDINVLTSGVETAITGGTCSQIYALQMGENAICGLQSPGGIIVEQVGLVQTKDVMRTRLKWYVGLADFCALKRGILIGVTD